MKFIYCCYGGAHSSPVAAAIHLGLLPTSRLPTTSELLQTAYFDRTPSEHIGLLLPAGEDVAGNEVYILGRGPAGACVVRAVMSALYFAGTDLSEVVLVDTLGCVNMPMRIGGLLSRRLGLVSIGRPIVTWGTLRSYRQLVALVQETLEKHGLSLPDHD